MRLRLGTIAICLAAAFAAPASAADHTATLDGSNTTFTWDGAAHSSLADPVGAGFPSCNDGIQSCEDILLNVQAGELEITLESPEGQQLDDPSGVVCGDTPCGSFQDFDGYIYKSNAAGEPQGDPLGDEDTDCASSFPGESCKLAVETGFYLIRVVYFLTFEGAYKGTAKLSGAAPAATAAPPTGTPQNPTQPGQPTQPTQPGQPSQPASQPKPSSDKAAKKKKLKACQKKAKKKKNKKKRKAALKRCAKKYK